MGRAPSSGLGRDGNVDRGWNFVQPLLFLLASQSYGLRSLFKVSRVRARTVRTFSAFCSAMLASQFSMLLISGMDLPIVAAYDFHDTGYYALATTASNILVVPFGAILTTLIPMLTGMSMGNERERMGRVLIRTTRLSTSLLAMIAVPLILGMPVLLRLWVGADYARHTLVFAEILAAAQLIRLTLAPYAIIAFSAGEQNRTLFSPAGESVVNLLLSLTLMHWLGAAGVALGTLIGACIGVAIHFWKSMALTRSMIFSRKRLLLEGILAPAAWALLPALLLAALLSLGGTLPVQLLLLCSSAALLGLLFWKATLRPEDKKTMRGLGRRLLPSSLRTFRMEI
jgi:O-antigen/teichoic acid export membrane protein